MQRHFSLFLCHLEKSGADRKAFVNGAYRVDYTDGEAYGMISVITTGRRRTETGSVDKSNG